MDSWNYPTLDSDNCWSGKRWSDKEAMRRMFFVSLEISTREIKELMGTVLNFHNFECDRAFRFTLDMTQDTSEAQRSREFQRSLFDRDVGRLRDAQSSHNSIRKIRSKYRTDEVEYYVFEKRNYLFTVIVHPSWVVDIQNGRIVGRYQLKEVCFYENIDRYAQNEHRFSDPAIIARNLRQTRAVRIIENWFLAQKYAPNKKEYQNAHERWNVTNQSTLYSKPPFETSKFSYHRTPPDWQPRQHRRQKEI